MSLVEKVAIVIDFNPKDFNQFENSAKYDLFVVDRYNDKIVNVETSEDNEFKQVFEQAWTMKEFHRIIAKSYKKIFCIFLSYDYCNIDDYVMTQDINKFKAVNEARMYTYLVNYKNQNKQAILDTTIEMIKKDYDIKDIIIRIHSIQKKESFSLNDVITRYITCLF